MTAATYRRRCPECGAPTVTAATRCPQCGAALASRDAAGRPLAWWGCPACRTLNPTDHATCHHCSAPRPRWRRLARWGIVLVVVAGLGALGVQRAGRPATPPADVLPPGPSSAPAGSPAAPPGIDSALAAPAVDTVPPPRPVGPVTITWVNVRSEPDRDARILGVIDPDTPVTILESDIGWHRVRAGALTGWVYAEGLTQP